jgi:hypothetical protein
LVGWILYVIRPERPGAKDWLQFAVAVISPFASGGMNQVLSNWKIMTWLLIVLFAIEFVVLYATSLFSPRLAGILSRVEPFNSLIFFTVSRSGYLNRKMLSGVFEAADSQYKASLSHARR